MFKSAIVGAFCALLLAEASMAAVVKRDCRALHQDHDYPNGDIPYECTPAGQAQDQAGSSSASSSSSGAISSSSASDTQTGTQSATVTFSALATNTASESSQSSSDTSTSSRPAATQPPNKQQPKPTDDNEYAGKFYQIRPAANDTMCLSAFVSWDNTIGQADTVNLNVYDSPLKILLLILGIYYREPCNCDKPEVQNKWTLDLAQDKTRIMIGKPKSANSTTWCIDGTTSEHYRLSFSPLSGKLMLFAVPTNDDHPHVRLVISV